MDIGTKYITMEEVVNYLSLSEGSIRKLIQEQSFPHVKVLRKYLFNKQDIDAWLKMHSQGLRANK
ncbi:MAG: helix-turn-helix domain-containing protein [Candidatus Omnitrophica bacterium]|nr:helix-turn-helix domain-containing protein [Candidatus Omnitrophota bacterium]